jgi:hypothetical protein
MPSSYRKVDIHTTVQTVLDRILHLMRDVDSAYVTWTKGCGLGCDDWDIERLYNPFELFLIFSSKDAGITRSQPTSIFSMGLSISLSKSSSYWVFSQGSVWVTYSKCFTEMMGSNTVNSAIGGKASVTIAIPSQENSITTLERAFLANNVHVQEIALR